MLNILKKKTFGVGTIWIQKRFIVTEINFRHTLLGDLIVSTPLSGQPNFKPHSYDFSRRRILNYEEGSEILRRFQSKRGILKWHLRLRNFMVPGYFSLESMHVDPFFSRSSLVLGGLSFLRSWQFYVFIGDMLHGLFRQNSNGTGIEWVTVYFWWL